MRARWSVPDSTNDETPENKFKTLPWSELKIYIELWRPLGVSWGCWECYTGGPDMAGATTGDNAETNKCKGFLNVSVASYMPFECTAKSAMVWVKAFFSARTWHNISHVRNGRKHRLSMLAIAT